MSQAPWHPSPREYSSRRTKVKTLLALAIVLTAAGILAFWLSDRGRNVTVPQAVNLPHNVNRQLSGYTFTRSYEGHRIFTIHAERTLAFRQGTSTVLEDVNAVIFGQRGDRHDELHAGRCRYSNQTGALACVGAASLKLEPKPGVGASRSSSSDPQALIQTADVSFDPRDNAVKSAAEVHFSFGQASGTAQGLSYDTKTGSLSLEKQVYARLAAGSTNQSPIDVHAGGLRYDKAAGEILLRDPVSFSRGLEHVSASTGTLFLNSGNRPCLARLEGHVSGSSQSPRGDIRITAQTLQMTLDPASAQPREMHAAGHVYVEARGRGRDGTRSLSADQVQLNISSGSSGRPQIRSGSASGSVQLVLEPLKSAAKASNQIPSTLAGKRVLTTPELQFSFHAGSVLQDVYTTGPGKIVLFSPQPQGDERSVSAGELRLAFTAQGRLRQILGLNSTHITDSPPPGAKLGSLRESFGRELVVNIDPTTQAIETAQQKGNFRFKEEDHRASAEKAFFQAQSQQLTLIGNPQMWDLGNRIRARHMVVNLAQGTALGWGEVQFVHREPGAQGVSEEPLIVTANRILVSKDKQEATYEGNVRAWQGANVVECSSLTVDRTSQEISSGHGVTTTLWQAQSVQRTRGDSPSRHPVDQELTVRAEHLVYANLRREAIYTGHVIMRSPEASIRADRLRVYLTSNPRGPKPAEVDRAVADGNVSIFQTTGRQAWGQHAEYSMAGGQLVLTGGPPAAYDPSQGFVTGDRLTFSLHDASLSADGGKKSQTLSKRILQR